MMDLDDSYTCRSIIILMIIIIAIVTSIFWLKKVFLLRQVTIKTSNQVLRHPDKYKQLHEAIQEGDYRLVSRLLQDNSSEKYFIYAESSALYKAFYCKKYHIVKLLIHKGAILPDSELVKLCQLGRDVTLVDNLLLEYNKKSNESCIYQLVSWSTSPQGVEGERLNALMTMFKELFESEITKLLMKILECEYFEIVYDFGSEQIKRLCCLFEENCKVFGKTEPESRQILIGGKDLLSPSSGKRRKVYGVVAEELCHLAMTVFFENNGKPYREDDSESKKVFDKIVRKVNSLIEGSDSVESVIRNVFSYPVDQQECELIARIPHVIAIYGDKPGRKVFQKYPELELLLHFYERNVLPKFREYLEPSLNTKHHQMMGRLMKTNPFLSLKEKQTKPLKEDFPSFKQFLVDEEGISLIITNSIKLCTLHIFHELKRKYEYMLHKKCLLFTRDLFEKKHGDILEAWKVILWDCLVLVLDEKELDLQKFKEEFLYEFLDFRNKDSKIIIISGSHVHDEKFLKDIVKYEWNHLTDSYKKLHKYVPYNFKGVERYLCILENDSLDLPKVFSAEDFTRIINNEVFEIDDGEELLSQGYSRNTYIERMFQAKTVEKKMLEDLPLDTCIFISGMTEYEFKEFSIDKNRVQSVDRSDGNIRQDASIFITYDKTHMTFNNFVKIKPKKNTIWLHYYGETFYLWFSSSSVDTFKDYVKPKSLGEKEILHLLERKRVVIISNSAGMGKSTVISSLTSNLKENNCNSWIWRIDFRKLSADEKDHLSSAKFNLDSDKDVLDYFFRILKLDNGIKKHLFEKSSRRGNCFLFFDGFDEVHSKNESYALKLLTVLNENTLANLIITTRKYRERVLEQCLGTYSLELIPFSRADQVRYLEKLWKNNLKDPCGKGTQTGLVEKKEVEAEIKRIIDVLENSDIEFASVLIGALEKIELQSSLKILWSEIEKLNFRKLAEHMIDKTSLDAETLEFMGIPLHLYMTGIIYYNYNFNFELQMDIHCLYLEFFEHKILILCKEKLNMCNASGINYMISKTREDAYRILTDIANELLEEEKVYLASSMSQKDLELCSALGVVRIYGREVHFLHQNYAEFFKAESIRQKLQKDIFKVLFDSKHNILRRFLSSSLEKKNFENPPPEFFQDFKFLLKIIKKIMSLEVDYAITDFDEKCIFKIVKKLLENFEEKVALDFKIEFVKKLHKLVMTRNKVGHCLLGYTYHSSIGGCLTAQMLKKLLTTNFSIHSFTLFGFVRYSENPNEVKNLVHEYTLIKTVGSFGSHNYKKKCRKIVARAKCFRKLFCLKDTCGKGLLYHALWNRRPEILIYFLNFIKEKHSIQEILKRRDQHGDNIIHLSVLNHSSETLLRNLDVIKEALGTEEWFDKLLRSKGQSSKNIFQLASIEDICLEGLLKLYVDHLEKDEIKQMLISTDEIGVNVFHLMVMKNSPKHLMENLYHIINILGDTYWFKRFLESKDENSLNAFHFASKMGIYLHDLLEFCTVYLESNQIKQLLSTTTKRGDNVIHLLVINNTSEILIKNLNSIQKNIDDNEWFCKICKTKGQSSKNIFQLASLENVCLDELLKICIDYLGIDEVRNLISNTEDVGANVLHLMVLKNSPDIMMNNLEYINEKLGGGNWFVSLLQSRDQHSQNILHYASLRNIYLKDLLNLFLSHIGEGIFKELLFHPNIFKDKFIHILVLKCSPDILLSNLKLLQNLLRNGEIFKNLLISTGQSFKNIFHFVSVKDYCFDGLLKFCSSVLGIKDIKIMLLSPFESGNKVIHLLASSNSQDILVKNLKAIKENLIDKESFKEFFDSKGQNSQNLFHCFSTRDLYLKDLLNFCNDVFGIDEIKDLILERDENGKNVIDCLRMNNSSELLVRNMDLIRKYVDIEESFT